MVYPVLSVSICVIWYRTVVSHVETFVTLCSLLEVYCLFKGACCLHSQGLCDTLMKEAASSAAKFCTSVRLHVVMPLDSKIASFVIYNSDFISAKMNILVNAY